MQILRIHDDVISSGHGFIETETERFDISMNEHNSNKLAILMTETVVIHAEISQLGKGCGLGFMFNPKTERNDDNTVFFTTD